MENSSRHKVLLLGTSESGKSCVRLMFDHLTQQARFGGLSEFMRISLLIEDLARVDWIEVGDILQWDRTTIDRLEQILTKSKHIGLDVVDLLRAGKLQDFLRVRHRFQKFQGIENTYFIASKYFSQKSDNLVTSKDALHLFIRTSGVVQEKYDLDGIPILLVDPGGAKSQRKKWQLVWDGTDTIVFCASLTSFRLLLWEDGQTNRYVDSLNVFNAMTSREEFHKCKWYLLLTHRDILEDCTPYFTEKELQELIPGYSGEKSAESIISFILETYAAIFQRNIGVGLEYQFIKMNGDTPKDILHGNFIPLPKKFMIKNVSKFQDVEVKCWY